MKAYTDLDQSKKLAEILPLETADMYRVFENNSETRVYYGKVPTAHFVCKPCWSLAALFGVIPQEIFDGEYVINITEGRDKKWVISYDYIRNENFSFCGLSSSTSNLVDACTDIIIKLKERNIL